MQDDLLKTLEVLAMPRGTVVVDENLANLAPFLEKKGIRVRLPPKGMSDEKIAEDYLPNRIFITNNSKDFVDMASEYDIGIIATENVVKDPEHLAKIISNAIKSYSLWGIRHGYVLVLKNDNKHSLKPLVD